ncbi:type II toxin-antitoxin system VapC family toxin [Candidatus Spongiisocius sp.]|uniref:type II toxin-antitoxin system VapC family toxin n=1 Tax=Candidatus Spongiisocius sp. TaxID=3101273 RepID=UPI003B5C6CF2
MTLYVDTSALMKRYVQEHDSEVAVQLMSSDPVLVTSRLTVVELRRNLARLLRGNDLVGARRRAQADLDAFALVSLDAATCNEAARIAEQTLCRSLDALHMAAALRTGASTTMLTFDIRQAQAARSTGLSVIGV